MLFTYRAAHDHAMVVRAAALLEQVSEAVDVDTEFMEVIIANTVVPMLKCKSARHNVA